MVLRTVNVVSVKSFNYSLIFAVGWGKERETFSRFCLTEENMLF